MVSPPSVLPVLLSVARAAGPRPAGLASVGLRRWRCRCRRCCGAVVGGAGCGIAAGGAGVGVGSGAGCVGCAACGAAAIGAGGGVGAGGVAADGVGVVTPAGTFLTDGAEACGATGCPLSLRSP